MKATVMIVSLALLLVMLAGCAPGPNELINSNTGKSERGRVLAGSLAWDHRTGDVYRVPFQQRACRCTRCTTRGPGTISASCSE